MISVWTIISIIALITSVFFPQYFPDFFTELKYNSFYANQEVSNVNTGLIFRNTGIYGSYQEAGMVILVGFIIAIGGLNEQLSKYQKLILYIAVFSCVFGIFLAGVRTPVIGMIIGIIFIIFLKGKYFFSFFRKNLWGLIIGVLLLIKIFSLCYTSSNKGLLIRFGYMNVALRVVSGDISKAYEEHRDEYDVPYCSLSLSNWLIGNGAQAYRSDGVKSDIGYIQLLWGTGLIGLLSIVLLYFWMLHYSIRIYKYCHSGLSMSVIAILIIYFIINLKGQYFVGIRSGDYVASSFGVLLGVYHNKKYQLRKYSIQFHTSQNQVLTGSDPVLS